MKILLSIVLIFLILVTSGLHVYSVWKKEDRKTMCVQLGLMVIAIIVGVVAIYDENIPSIVHFLNMLSPIGNGKGGL